MLLQTKASVSQQSFKAQTLPTFLAGLGSASSGQAYLGLLQHPQGTTVRLTRGTHSSKIHLHSTHAAQPTTRTTAATMDNTSMAIESKQAPCASPMLGELLS
jgi:hypothetical protein